MCLALKVACPIQRFVERDASRLLQQLLGPAQHLRRVGGNALSQGYRLRQQGIRCHHFGNQPHAQCLVSINRITRECEQRRV